MRGRATTGGGKAPTSGDQFVGAQARADGGAGDLALAAITPLSSARQQADNLVSRSRSPLAAIGQD